MKNNLILLLLATISLKSFSQIPKNPINIQAPNAAAINPEISFKLESFTGRPEIGINLKTVKDGEINIPINLTYNASGVKPDEHPGWVGLNFSLGVGGAITRVIKDLADDMPLNTPIPDTRSSGFFNNQGGVESSTWNTEVKVIELASQEQVYPRDTEPDEFSFNAMGISGKFYFSTDGTFKLICDQDIKIEIIDNSSSVYPPFIPQEYSDSNHPWLTYNNGHYQNHIGGFVLTDEKGTKYEFGGGDNSYMEYSKNFFYQGNGKETWLCNAWHLKSITTSSGQTANFNYERGDFIAQMYLSIYNKEYSLNGSEFLSPGCSEWNSLYQNYGPYNGKLISPIYLKYITTNNTRIDFTSSESVELKYDYNIFNQHINYRISNPIAGEASYLNVIGNLYECYYPPTQGSSCATTIYMNGANPDVPALLGRMKWRKLDKITISNIYDFLAANEFHFTYTNDVNTRLTLLKVQEKAGNTNGEIEPYEFFYNSSQTATLPNYSKSHTDHWGFNNNLSLTYPNDFLNYSSYGFNFREPITGTNNVNLLLGTLNKIKLPTGGYAEFEFEPHKYRKQVDYIRWSNLITLNSDAIAGGLRIKTIKTYESPTATPIIKSYYYKAGFNPASGVETLANLPSSGILGGQSQYFWDNYKPKISNNNATYKERVFSVQSVLSSSENSMGSHIGYSEIIENSSDNGWTIYKYSNFDTGTSNEYMDEEPDFSLQTSSTAYQPFNSFAFKRGKLLEKTDFTQVGVPVQSLNFTYGSVGNDFARSVKTDYKFLCNTGNVIYEGTAYKIYTHKYRLFSENIINYNQANVGQTVTTSTNFQHNIYGQTNRITKSQSDGSQVISLIKYVPDYNRQEWNQCRTTYFSCLFSCIFGGNCAACATNYTNCRDAFDESSRAILEMHEKHIWLPVETINYRNRSSIDKVIGGNLNEYKMYNGIPLLEKVYKLQLKEPLISGTVPVSEINASKQFVSSSFYNQPEITFNNYNSAGNPTQITARNGLVTCYVWGYKNRLPIAEIKNETYSIIAAALGSDENLLLNSFVSEADIRSKINALRTTNNRKVTTYTHNVIFGVKSITNPANITSYFVYDGIGRFNTAKDNEGKIMKDIVYQYANQTAQTGLGATPTNTINYIVTRTPRTKQDNINTDVDFTSTQINYIDGIGRPVQNLIWKGSPDKTKDIISNSNLFDVVGRNDKVILPTRSDGILGQFKTDTQTKAIAFYRDNNPFNQTIFESSPLNRPIEQFGAGQEWRAGTPKPQKFFYETNGSTSIPLYTADENGIIKGTANYPSNQLFMTRVQDEKENEIVEIKDIDGKTIQKRIVNDNNELLVTHFVYNDLNQLKGVIQPNAYPLLADISKTSDNLFFYNYDIRSRIIEKKVPASDPEYFVYDQWDRLVLSQTPLQKTSFKWSFYKYDVFNREILRGEKNYTNTDTQASLQLLAEVNNNRSESKNTTPPIFYNYNSSFPVLNFVQNNANSDYIYQINFYDSYEYTNDWASGLDYVPNETPHAQITLNGSFTGTKLLGKPKDNNNNWLRTAHYYDFNNRLIQSRKEHLLANSANVCSYEYNFAGELLRKKTTHKKTGKSDLIEIVLNTLDHLGRIKFIDQTVGNITKRIAVYEYDDIGRMITKNLGTPANFTGSNSRQSIADGNWNTDATWNNFQIPNIGSLVEISHLVTIPTGENAYAGGIILNTNTLVPNGTLTLGGVNSAGNALQKVDYQHHIRGGLKGINLDMSQSLSINSLENDFFSYKLEYDFDYNIKKQSWKHEGIDNNRSYDFTYDKSHRLQTATYLPAGQDISITNLDYDKNGNISKLQRDGKKGTGFGQIDDLTYDYTGNRLTHMQETEAGNYDVDFVRRGNQNYAYYNDGSLKSDDNEDITEILYDTFLRQPTQITLTGNRKIDYIYSGAGELLQTDYSGTIIEKWNNVENLIYKGEEYYSLNTAEGRVNYTNTNWEFEYFITDHLGNVRVSFKDNGSGVATKTAITDRDPLGVILRNTQIINGIQNRNEFQGKSSELTFGLNRIDLGARTMNPTIGRLDKIDPLTEKFSGLSSYAYVANNPVLLFDINGEDWTIFKTEDKDGRIHYQFTFTAAVLNSSSKKFDMVGFAKSVISQTENLFKLAEKRADGSANFILTTDVNLRIIQNEKDLASDESLIQIKDNNDSDFKSSDPNSAIVAKANTGKRISVNSDFVNDMISNKNSKTIPHEIGHTAGLMHPKEDTSLFGLMSGPTFNSGKSNLMNQGYITNPTGPTKEQINRIYRLYQNGGLNKNSGVHPVDQK